MLTKIIIFCLSVVPCVMFGDLTKCTKGETYIATESYNIFDVYTYELKNKIITRQGWRSVKTCCEGYTRIEDFTVPDGFMCIPDFCNPSCFLEQFCVRPGVCNCNFLDCKPFCHNDCGNGYCTAPGVCQCYPGWSEVTNNRFNTSFLCEPLCEDCDGKCVEPDTCISTNETTAEDCPNCPASSTLTLPAINEAKPDESIKSTASLEPTSPESSNSLETKTDVSGIFHPAGIKFIGRLPKPTTLKFRTSRKSTTEQATTQRTTRKEHSTKSDIIHLVDNTSYKEINSSIPDTAVKNPLETENNATRIVKPGGANSTQIHEEARNMSWIEKNGISVLLPILSVLAMTLVILLLLLWQRTAIMVFFRARYYVVDDHLPDDKESSRQVHYSKRSEVADFQNVDLKKN